MATDSQESDVALDSFLDQLAELAKNAASVGRCTTARPITREEELGQRALQGCETRKPSGSFYPAAPRSLAEAHVSESDIQTLILRSTALRGSMQGVEIAQQIGLPFATIEKLLHAMKAQRLLIHKGAGALSDFCYEITEGGANKLRQDDSPCTYCGTAPVSLADYEASVAAQSLTKLEPQLEDVQRAFADLTLSSEMMRRLGLAIASGRGLFLYGQPGNGKTSMAERITAVFGSSIWIPRAISVWGEIVRLFDPSCHQEQPQVRGNHIVDDEKIDHRWVRIRRPTIAVGGELTLKNLEITVNEDTGVAEAPVQMKSNCGTLLIDDFGRQRVAPADLLNRWIVPLEKRQDYLSLASGRKFSVPFDQIIVFSTNLEPKDLVDEAFLRRIPYKIEVENPTIDQFRTLFQSTCRKLDLEFNASALDHLLTQHYERAGRELRFCHPRDLLQQVDIFCRFLNTPREVSVDAIDVAAKNYFSATGV